MTNMTRLGAITIGREITMSTMRQKNVRNIWRMEDFFNGALGFDPKM